MPGIVIGGAATDGLELVGNITQSARNAPPRRCLLCDGSAVSPARYPELYNVLKPDGDNTKLNTTATAAVDIYGGEAKNSLVFVDGVYYLAVFIIDSLYIYQSSDLQSWTRRLVWTGTNADELHGMRYINGNFVVMMYCIVGSLRGVVLVHATDPAGTWTAKTVSGSSICWPRPDDVIWDGERYIVVWHSVRSGVSSERHLEYASALDGDYTSLSIDFTALRITRGGGYYVVAGNGFAAYATSITGAWTQVTLAGANGGAVLYKDGYYIATGADASGHPAIFYASASAPGTWMSKTVDAALTGSTSALEAGGGLIYAVGLTSDGAAFASWCATADGAWAANTQNLIPSAGALSAAMGTYELALAVNPTDTGTISVLYHTVHLPELPGDGVYSYIRAE